MHWTVNATSRSNVSIIYRHLAEAMNSDITALAEKGADEDFELADKMRGVDAVLVHGVEKLRFIAGTWSVRHRLNASRGIEVG